MKHDKPHYNRLWCRLIDHHHHHHHHHHHQDPPPDLQPDLTPDQQTILASFTQTVIRQFGDEEEGMWKARYLVVFLQEANWQVDQALADLESYQEANFGLLVPPPDKKTKTLQGFENDQGTSCYLDTLLFTMYLGMTSFDPMLMGDPVSSVSCPSTPLSPQQQVHHRHHRFFSRSRRYRHKLMTSLLPSHSDKTTLHIDTNLLDNNNKMDRVLQRKHHLQRTLRLVINKLRQGQLVKQGMVAHLRQDLSQNGWYGQDSVTKQWQQEDVSELFLFLTSIFDSPYLPFQLRLFHGANTDLDDDRILTDRLLPLSLPKQEEEANNEPIRLETILVDHFYNSVVKGVKRQLDTQRLTEVDAWQAMELLPFYSSSDSEQDYSDIQLVLPIVLKRYKVDQQQGTSKDDRLVLVPETIPFHQFVNQNTDQARCAQCDQSMEHVLSLKSVICHIGSSPQSGHYTAYANQDHIWLKFGKIHLSKDLKTNHLIFVV
ncbi:hypothetical protein BC941DRAFT_150876 [Chlamydoabsidia padenii]|nr:hypothetical protein BC941DRAFT_150876 [Chlamydoabsidia padenii]